mmetsp:Transcript_12347/g.19469  ORF Transcript_12347/g.19469 Transcript_12347/m.19469 type:complete len:125 (+) Transcript_12347:1167-1541(+)
MEVERELSKVRGELRKEQEFQKVIEDQDRVYRDRSMKLRHRLKEMNDAMEGLNSMLRESEEMVGTMNDDFSSARGAAGSQVSQGKDEYGGEGMMGLGGYGPSGAGRPSAQGGDVISTDANFFVA